MGGWLVGGWSVGWLTGWWWASRLVVRWVGWLFVVTGGWLG